MPHSAGLGGLISSAADVEHLLSLVLDAISAPEAALPALAEVGPALRDLGDALDLRAGGAFDAAALSALAADPAAGLVARIRANTQAALAALSDLVGVALPADTVTVDASTGSVRAQIGSSPLGITLTVPVTGALMLCADIAGFRPVAGLDIGGTLCASTTGLLRFELGLDVTEPTLLEVAGFSFFPFCRFLVGPDAPGDDRVEAGLRLAPPAAPDRESIVLVVPFGDRGRLVCRPDGGPDHADLVPCVTQAARIYVIPLLVDLVTMSDAVTAALDQPVPALGSSLGSLLDGNLLTRSSSADPWRLRDDALEPGGLLDGLVDIVLAAAATITSPLDTPSLAPFSISFVSENEDLEQRAGLSVTAPPGQGLTLVDTGEVAIALEADASWFPVDPQPTPAGVSIILAVRDEQGVRFEPELRVDGLGLRVSSPSSDKLFDVGFSVRSIAIHAALHRRGTGVGTRQHVGGHFELDRLGVPLGLATGDNPVAAKILSSGADSTQAGDQSSLTPAFSPAVVVWSDAGAESILLRAGPPPGPWWLPIQRSFGPVYVEQVGVGSVGDETTTTAVQLLVDGGLKMLGLDIAVDDLSVTVPLATPLQPATWRLGLAGLAIGFEGSGVSIAGGLRERRRPTPAGQPALPPDYVGMVRVSFGQYGITAVGGYGEFPDGAGGTYTSLFLFGALSAADRWSPGLLRHWNRSRWRHQPAPRRAHRHGPAARVLTRGRDGSGFVAGSRSHGRTRPTRIGVPA